MTIRIRNLTDIKSEFQKTYQLTGMLFHVQYRVFFSNPLLSKQGVRKVENLSLDYPEQWSGQPIRNLHYAALSIT